MVRGTNWFLSVVVKFYISCVVVTLIFPSASAQTTSTDLRNLRSLVGSNQDNTLSLFNNPQENFTSSLLASEYAEGGGYAYLPDWIDTKGMSVWVRLLSSQDSKRKIKNWSQRRRVIFTTDTKGIESKCQLLLESGENSKNYSVIYTSPAYAFMTLSLIETSNISGSKISSTFSLNLEYAISLSVRNNKSPHYMRRHCRRLRADSQSIHNYTASKIGSGSSISINEWTHIGLTITPNLDTQSELIRLYVNGTMVAERNELHRIFRREGKLGSFQPSFQPLKTEGNRTPKTFLGRTSIPGEIGRATASVDALNGHLSTLVLFDYPAVDGKTAGNNTEFKMLNYLNAGFTYHRKDINPSSASTKLSNLYTFEETDESKLDSVSILGDLITGCHGNIRRNIFREPFVRHDEYRYDSYKYGSFVPPLLSAKEVIKNDNLARQRRKQIRNAMKHAWEGYRTYAWGQDEIKPLSKQGHDNMGGMGVTLVDSLSTLWLMDMKDEFWEASHWIRNHWSLEHVGPVSVFETTIRSLGGLLSAYDFSGDKMFMETADDLANRLSNAFHSSSGIPYSETVLNGNHSFNSGWHSQHAVLSELGTMQLEFRHLAAITGKRKYADLVEKVIISMEAIQPDHGLFPLYIFNNYSNKPEFGSNKISFGAMGDSFYEYLLKVWLQGGRVEAKYRLMYDKAMDGLHKILVYKTNRRGLTYIADLDDMNIVHKMDQ